MTPPTKDLHLPDALRAELRRPLGPVLSGARAFEEIRAAKRVVAVGDASTADLLERGRPPDVAVVDFRTQRAEDGDLRARVTAYPATVIRATNPPATLTRDLWRAMDEAFKSGQRVRIEVLGEEDLATLAAIALAPEGTAVLYGQPGEGVVLVWVDARAKAAVGNLLRRMV